MNVYIRNFLLTMLFVGLVPLHGMTTAKSSTITDFIEKIKEQIAEDTTKKNPKLHLYLLEAQKLQMIDTQTKGKLPSASENEAIEQKEQEIFTWYLEHYANILTTPVSIAYKQNKKLTALASALVGLGIYTACKHPDTVLKEGTKLVVHGSRSMAASGKELTQNLWSITKNATTTLSQKAKDLFNYYWPRTTTPMPTLAK